MWIDLLSVVSDHDMTNTDITDTLRSCLLRTCEATKFDVGRYCSAKGDNGELSIASVTTVTSDNERASEALAKLLEADAARINTIGQRTARAAKSIWLEDMSVDRTGAPTPFESVFSSCFGVPVFQRGIVVGVFEFYSTERRSTDELAQRVVGLVGQQLSRLMHTLETQAELLKANELLNVMLSNVAAGVVACDADGKLTLFNDVSKSFHGLDVRHDLNSSEWAGTYDLFRLDGTALPADEIPLVRAHQGKPLHGQEIIIAPHGLPKVVVSCSGRALQDTDGNTIGAVVVMHDISERVEREQKLRENNELLRRALDTITDLDGFKLIAEAFPEIVYTTSAEGKVSYLNKKFYEHTGCGPIERGQWDWAGILPRFVHPDDVTPTATAWTDAINASGRFETEFRVKRKDGAWRSHLARAVPVRNKDGVVMRYIGTLTDINDQRQAMVALAQTRNRLSALLHSNALLVWSMDSEGIFTLVEGKLGGALASRFLPEQETVGRSYVEVFKDYPALVKAAEASLSNESLSLEVLFEERWLYITFSPDLAGHGVVGVCQDISDRKIAQQQKAEADIREQAALEASKATRFLLSCCSHELRTPLHSLVAASELLADTHLTDNQQELISTILSSSRSLLSLISDLLELQRIESGKFKVETVTFSLKEFFSDMKTLWTPAAKLHGIDFHIHIHTGENDMDEIAGDPKRLAQVLNNLISNAVKGTPSGSIEVEARHTSTPEWQHVLHVAVVDTGVGMSPTLVSKLFQPFSTNQQLTSDSSGLGLYLVSRLVDAMDGSINVESEVGKGSRLSFVVRFGHRDVNGRRSRRESDEEARPRNRSLYGSMDSPTRSHGSLAISPPPPKEAASKSMRELHQIVGPTPQDSPPILTLQAQMDARTMMHNVPHSASMPALSQQRKPTTMTMSFPTLPGIPIARQRPLKIVIVEDNSTNLKLLTRMLTLMGHTISGAATGCAALSLILGDDYESPASNRCVQELEESSASFKNPRPYDIILMDCNLGDGLDGWECSRRIRQQGEEADEDNDDDSTATPTPTSPSPSDVPTSPPLKPDTLPTPATQIATPPLPTHTSSGSSSSSHTHLHPPPLSSSAYKRARKQWYREVPIIAVTADVMDHNKQRCLDAGMSDFLTKPADRQSLSRVIAKWCP
ncbi:uncharacterized protein EV422DRAFT_515015 [Fimicolochytrium jonesii]|uniref:uncharacterized protein n=1 Tax=Fimicolochytrium jonesii TaxID=1396493 RepID=UPI0022FE24DF|nr:uncharacterized protein EV422DRAFT_515015 [Fimicolochytrium jonesii]KAI8826015.1 hypothetical protein EV422DRAFT_515015 [Fimicolochytrium jonesii]